MVDEVQTGCGPSGEMWAHNHWNLPSPPDIVSFSKKAFTGGYYYADSMRINEVLFSVEKLLSQVSMVNLFFRRTVSTIPGWEIHQSSYYWRPQ